MSEPSHLPLLRELMALAQTGLGFTQDVYDRERYQRIEALAVELMTLGLALPEPAIREALVQEPGYATPKIEVRGGVIRDGRVLLVREITDGKWALPGGYADINLSPAEAIEAEIVQESGYRTKASKLVALLDRRRHHASHPILAHCYKLFFLCDLIGGAPHTSIETSDVGFFLPDGLPALSLGRNTPAQIALLFEHHIQRDLPAVFD